MRRSRRRLVVYSRHMDINQSINRTATMHPYSTAVVGLLFVIAGFYIATSYVVEGYLKMVSNSGDFMEALIQREWIEKDIKARKDMTPEMVSYFKEKIDTLDKKQIDDLVDRVTKKLEADKKLSERQAQLDQVELLLFQKREVVSFYYWYFRMLGIFAAILLAIGTMLTTKGVVRIRFSAADPHHRSTKHAKS